MPWLRCPTCDSWAERTAWREPPGQAFPFRIACPSCTRECDVDEPEVRLYAPRDSER